MKKFGVGYYQLTDLILETGQPIARNLLAEERQLELLSHPKGNSDYVAKSVLLHTDFQVKENIKKLKQLIIPEGEKRVVNIKMHNGVNYAMLDLDEFGVDLAGSQQNPDEFIWITLINDDQRTLGYIAFYNQQMTLFSDYPVNISGQVNDIQLLCVNTLADVLIEKPLRAVQINIFCHALEMDAGQTQILLKATRANFLCFGLCYISAATQLLTGHCQIKAGVFIHKGHIESEQSMEVMAELIEMHGGIAAKGKKGVTVVTLGLQAYKSSHLHGGVVNLITGARVDDQMDTQKDLIGEVNLAGLISARGLNISAAQATLSGKSYIQGDINIYTAGNNDKFLLEKTAKIIFNGCFFRQHSQLGVWVDGAVWETPRLEVYWKRIITPDLALTETEQLRCQIPQKVVSDSMQTPVNKLGLIEFLPVLPEQESYLYKPYDKTQFECLEINDTAAEEKTRKIIFSAEYLEVTGNFSITSAQIMFQGEHIEFSAHFGHISFFGCVGLFLKSVHLNLYNTVIDTDKQGSVVLTAEQDMQISNCQIAAEKIVIQADSLSFPAKPENRTETMLSAASKIIIHSKHDSEIAEGSKLTLTSPEPVIWQCENFDHRGTLNFQQLSLKAENMVSIVFAKMQGERLDLDSRYFLAGISSFKIDTFSVQSVVSLIGFCFIASDYYSNTSIVNLSCALYTPSTLSLSLKSGLALCLATANTAISILQLVLHEPTTQLALTAARLGINAGPALLQAFQLAKDIHVVTQAPQVTRGNLIKIANQTKTLLLSLGVLAYGGAGVAKQLVHIAELQNKIPAANTWSDVLSTINNLNSVVTPLLSTFFPGKHVSSFFNMDLDVSACFSSTNYSLFDIHGGINSSLMATRSSLVGVDPNPLSVDSNPILSADTTLYSLDLGQGSVLPMGPHSERALKKTIVCTPIPTLGEYVSLAAHELIVVGPGEHEFKKSSIQADDVFIAKGADLKLTDSSMHVAHQVVHEGEAKLNHSQITAKDWESIASSKIVGEQSQLKTGAMLIAKDAHMEFTNSVVSVSGQVEDSGKTQFTHSLVSADHWQGDKDSVTLFQQSELKGSFDNQGAIEFVQTKVDAEIHNHDGASILALDSDLNLKITDDHGATMQIVASKLKTDQWQEAGLFAADAGSDIEGHGVNITKDAKVGSRMTNWNVELTSEVDIPLDFKGTHFTGTHPQEAGQKNVSHHYHGNKQDAPKDSAIKPVEFKYVDDSKLSANLQADGIHYHSDDPVEIKNMDLISAMPIHVDAPNLTVSGHNTSTTSFSLTGNNHVVFNHGNTTVNGSLNVQSGGDVIFTGGQTLAGGGFKINGKEEIVIRKGAELLAKGDIDLESKKKVISIGEKKVETHTEEQDHFLRTDKSTTITTHFKNNQIISDSGDVTVHSDNDMLLEGTDAAGQNIILDAKADIDLNALTGIDSISKNHTNFLGLHHDKFQQTVDTASPNNFVAEKKLIFVTPGNVHNVGSELSAKEDIEYVLSKNSHLTNTAIILSSHTKETHDGLGFHSFGGMKLPLDTHQYVSQLPLVQDSQQLAQSTTMDDKMSAIMHLSTDAINTADSVLSATRTGGIIAGLEQLLLPNLNLTWRFGKSTRYEDHQWVGPGDIVTKHLSISAKEASFANNFGINAESSYFDVDKISSTGAELHNRVVCQDSFVMFALFPMALFHPSLNNVGFTHSYYSSVHDVWQGDAAHLGDLTLQTDTANFYGSQWYVNSLTGNVNKLIADAAANYAMQTNYCASLNSSGNFSFSTSEKFSNTAAVTTPFVGENGKPYDAKPFSIDTFVSHGEKITDIHTDHSEYVPVYEVNKEHDFNISGSGRDLLSGNHNAGQIFSTWNFRLTRDEGSHIGFTAPIYHPVAGKRFADNINWVINLSHSKPSPLPAEVKTEPRVHHIKYARRPSVDTVSETLDLVAHYEQSQILPFSIGLFAISQQLENPALIFADDNQSDSRGQQSLAIKAGLMPGTLNSSAEETQPLYRGDGRHINEIFNNGFNAYSKTTNLVLEDMEDPEDYWAEREDLIYTTLIKDVAARYPEPPTEDGRSYLYEIYSTRPAIKFRADELDVEKERVFTEKIFPHEIKGAWEVNTTKEEIADVEDFSFITASWDADAIEELYYEYNHTIGDEFISNPNFISPSLAENALHTARSIGYFFTGVGMTLDGLSLYHEFQGSKESGQYGNTYREALRIAGSWSSAWAAGLSSAEAGVKLCAPLEPYGSAICGFSFGLIGSMLGYDVGSALTTRIYDNNILLAPLEINSYLTLDKLDEIFLPELKDFLLIGKSEANSLLFAEFTQDDTADFGQHERIFHINFGPIVEMLENDLRQLERWNHSSQKLFKSDNFIDYLISSQFMLQNKEAIFKDFVDTVLDPIASVLYDRGSYFYPMYRHPDSSQFLSNVFEQPDVFKMAEQAAINIDHYAEKYTSLMDGVRIFYISNLLVQNSLEIMQGEPILSLVKEDVYSTVGSIAAASVSERMIPYCLDIANKMTDWLIKPISWTCKLSLPIAGMIGGTVLGEYLAHHDKKNDMDISISLAGSRQFWQAGTLREILGARFIDDVLPNYSADFLSIKAIESYFSYTEDLRGFLSPIGQSLIKPMGEIFRLSQIADKFSKAETIAVQFPNGVSDHELLHDYYDQFVDDTEWLSKDKVNGEFFREIIDKHSDFSERYINGLKNIGMSLFVLGVVESLYELATADDKINTAERLGLSWAAAEGGGYLGALAGAELCGPFSPLCVIGLGLAGGATGVVLAEKVINHQPDDNQSMPSLNTFSSFFKPSEWIQRQEKLGYTYQPGFFNPEL